MAEKTCMYTLTVPPTAVQLLGLETTEAGTIFLHNLFRVKLAHKLTIFVVLPVAVAMV